MKTRCENCNSDIEVKSLRLGNRLVGHCPICGSIFEEFAVKIKKEEEQCEK